MNARTTKPGGRSKGHAGDRDTSNSGRSVDVSVMQRSERYSTAWGDVVINAEGNAVMNGVVMTQDNSSLVHDPWTGGLTRVLNSLINNTPTSLGNKKSINKTATQIAVENDLAGDNNPAANVFQKDISNARIATLNKVVSDNAHRANSKQ